MQIHVYQVDQALQRIAVDIHQTKGKKYISVIGDYFTKWIQEIPFKSVEATYVATKL